MQLQNYVMDVQTKLNHEKKEREVDQAALTTRYAETPEVGGPGGHVPPQVFGYQLTLFESRGQIMPAILLPCPPIFLDDAAFLIMVQKIHPRGEIWVQSNRPQAGHLPENENDNLSVQCKYVHDFRL